jgi:RNA polymerase sigma factor (sigma-70 family)
LTFTPENFIRVQQGDSKSQRELFDHFQAKVMGICRRFTKNKTEAEDVAQESFIRVFNNIQQVKDAAHLESWIRKVTINTAVDYYKRNKRHEHADEKNGFNHKDGEYDLILSNFTDQMIVNIINQLPDGYRMVFNLNVVEGYSHAEIAVILNISESTSRSQLNRARQILKSKLQPLGIIRYERSA